jgi:hypothetical protein
MEIGMIRPIETRYKGYRFRSRLEARWAVFFDNLAVRWEYEPQGFHTPYGPYLPDFFLPDLALWVEIKPEIMPGENRQETTMKVAAAVQASGDDVRGIVFRGDPMSNTSADIYARPGVGDWSACAIIGNQIGGTGAYDCPYVFCICPWTGRAGVQFDGRGARITPVEKMDESALARLKSFTPVDDRSHYENIAHGDKAYSASHPRILEAARIARAVRFEHGEVPA